MMADGVAVDGGEAGRRCERRAAGAWYAAANGSRDAHVNTAAAGDSFANVKRTPRRPFGRCAADGHALAGDAARAGADDPRVRAAWRGALIACPFYRTPPRCSR
ncbi:hypothetical protein X997_5534 [Burkholderia pseudomallei A79C]|nr:hypothetical protein X997_5534 [Burkholderia pseudomallei A79C]